MLTRLGEAGVDTFTIMRIGGHSRVKVSERYVHPSAEAMERAFERLEAVNNQPVVAENGEIEKALATISATLEDVTSESQQPAAFIQ